MKKRNSNISLVNLSGIHESGPFIALRKGINELFHKKSGSPIQFSEKSENTYENMLSVIICTANRRNSAQQAIFSVLNQDFPEALYEVILVNNSEAPFENPPVHKNLRIIDEKTQGLSIARNTGAAAANGEFLLYLDDDALADESLLSNIFSAFSKHTGFGIIGGQIILDMPTPVPELFLKGRESVWSGYTVEYNHFKEAKEQYEFPYGACFGIRHSLLDAIGGFPVSYGRKGNDYAGGEETAVCFAIKNLGSKIGIEPKAKVTHCVPKERFTKEHIKNTIKEGIITTYRLFSDGYAKSGWSLSYVNHQINIIKSELLKHANDTSSLFAFYKKCELDGFYEVREMIKSDLETKPTMLSRIKVGRFSNKDFKQMKKYLNRHYPIKSADLKTGCVKGMVSVVLPVYNCEKYLEESIVSVISQTYTNLELIIVDDGSSDLSGAIADSFLNKDSRIRVIHQKNMTLPVALNTGFSVAQGEFFTWTSADNRMLPTCLEHLTAQLMRDRGCDMVFGNMRLIDQNGDILKGRGWYELPPLSGNVMLPDSVDSLNTYPNNTIGAAFMYRAGADRVLNGYCKYKFMLEDYDYFMRMNSLFTIKHILCKTPIYEYRMHPESLTARDEELKITASRPMLMELDKIRRGFYTHTIGFYMDGENTVLERCLCSVCKRIFTVKTANQLAEKKPAEIFYINCKNELPTWDVPSGVPKILFTDEPCETTIGYDVTVYENAATEVLCENCVCINDTAVAAAFAVLRAKNDIMRRYEAES